VIVQRYTSLIPHEPFHHGVQLALGVQREGIKVSIEQKGEKHFARLRDAGPSFPESLQCYLCGYGKAIKRQQAL
jgi:hypothetical protein